MKPDREVLRALDSVTRFLARRDHSELELRQKLSRRYEADVVEKAIEETKVRGFLKSPEELAALFQSSLERRGRSHRHILHHLRKKGLPPPIRRAEVEEEKCRTLLKTKFGKAANLSHEERLKAYRFLSYRGFDGATIRRVIYEKS